MTGREKFEKYERALDWLVRFLRKTPVVFRVWLADAFSTFGGNLSVAFRYCIFKSLSSKFGRNVYVGRYVVLKNMNKLVVGHNVSIHDSCYIDAVGCITIGDNVSIAHQSSIISFNHQWLDTSLPIKYNSVDMKPVEILDDVWIGCGVRIMPGVTIGERSIVAAGSVVTKDIPSGSIVAGVPAKIIGNTNVSK